MESAGRLRVNTQITIRPDDPKRTVPTVPPPARQSRWLGLLALAICIVSTFAIFEIFLPAPVPPELRGKWLVVEGEGMKGSTLEFHRNGDLIMVALGRDGKEIKMQSKVEIAGNRFRVTTPGGPAGFEVTETQDILELTGDIFVTQDSKGEVMFLERIPTNAPAGTIGSGKWPRRNTPNAK